MLACFPFRTTTINKLSTFLTPRSYQLRSFCKNQALKMESQPNSKRPTCLTCSKPLALCLCTRLKTLNLDNKVHVTILQHSLEKKHPLNSARIAKLGLRNVDVFTVSDVNFEAQFVIQPLELDYDLGFLGESTLGVCGNASESLDPDWSLEVKRSRKRDFDQVDELDSGDGFVQNLDSEQFLDFDGNSGAFAKEDVGALKEYNEGVVLEAKSIITIRKYGEISSISHPWELPDEGKTPKFEQLIASHEAVKSLGRGFVVKKLQQQQRIGSTELEQFQEFELRIPPNSALLFPSQKSVPIEAVDFEVNNLVVLDGTWAKANRMYNENPWLKVLPCVRLDVEKMSLFSEVRHQPKPGYLSTIESIVYAMEALGERGHMEGLDNLLDVFRSMVEDQRKHKDERLRKLSKV